MPEMKYRHVGEPPEGTFSAEPGTWVRDKYGNFYLKMSGYGSIGWAQVGVDDYDPGAGIPISNYSLGQGSTVGSVLFDLPAVIEEMERTGQHAYIPGGEWEPNTFNVPMDNVDVSTPYVSAGFAQRFNYVFKGSGKQSRLRLPAEMGADDWLLIANSEDVNDFQFLPKIICRDFSVAGHELGHDTNFMLANQRSIWADNIFFTALTRGFRTTGYTDVCKYDHVTAHSMTSVEGAWMIENRGNGDGFDINSSFAYGTRGISLQGVVGGVIRNCVQAFIELRDSQITMQDNHLEGDGTTDPMPVVFIRRSAVRFTGGLYQTKPFRNTIEIDDGDSTVSTQGSRVTFDPDVRFVCRIDDPGSSYGNIRGNDIHITNLYRDGSIRSAGSVAMYMQSTSLATDGSGFGRVGRFGFNVTSDNADIQTALTDRRQLRAGDWFLSFGRGGAWSVTQPPPNDLVVDTSVGAQPFLSVQKSDYDQIDSFLVCDLPTGTYYYAYWVIDRAFRASDISVEGSITTTPTNPGAVLVVNTFIPNVRIVVLRGISTGVYTHYAAVNLINPRQNLIDQGSAISGVEWSDVDVPAYTTDGGAGAIRRGIYRLDDGSSQIASSAAPTVGTWARGDICFNNNATAGGPAGWICVTAGTPGTWKAMANLAS